jgi:chromosome segregation protein
LEKVRHEKETRLNLLGDLEKEFDGFARSVKEIMLQKERGRLKGIEGTVSQMIRVKEETAVAVEVSLGGSLQNVIVGTEEEAKAAISFLKANNYGRATFLPVSAIRGGALREDEIREKEGFVGVASSWFPATGATGPLLKAFSGAIVSPGFRSRPCAWPKKKTAIVSASSPWTARW